MRRPPDVADRAFRPGDPNVDIRGGRDRRSHAARVRGLTRAFARASSANVWSPAARNASARASWSSAASGEATSPAEVERLKRWWLEKSGLPLDELREIANAIAAPFELN